MDLYDVVLFCTSFIVPIVCYFWGYRDGLKERSRRTKTPCIICGIPLKDHRKIVSDGTNFKCFVNAKGDPESKAKFGKFTGIE